MDLINPLHATGLFVHSLIFWCIQGICKGTSDIKWVDSVLPKSDIFITKFFQSTKHNQIYF